MYVIAVMYYMMTRRVPKRCARQAARAGSGRRLSRRRGVCRGVLFIIMCVSIIMLISSISIVSMPIILLLLLLLHVIIIVSLI